MKQTAQSKAESAQKINILPPKKHPSSRGFFHPLSSHYQTLIPPHEAVLHLGCQDGSLLNVVQASCGVGIESSIQKAQTNYPEFSFYSTIDQVPISLQFDYIVISHFDIDTIDVQRLLLSLQTYCHPGTRIIIETESYSGLFVRSITAKIVSRANRRTHYIAPATLNHFAYLADLDIVTQFRHTATMHSIPFINPLLSRGAQVPLLNTLCTYQTSILRPAPTKPKKTASVSVIIPCKNEAGNIERAVKECPSLGDWMELIFIEGHSSDHTADEIKRVIAAYPEKRIRYFVQPNRGKADAVRIGFQHAQGDILVILDGDLTVAPHTLPAFVHALVTGKGECINGSRLVYGMEKEAMMLTAWLANHFFARLLSFIMRQRITDSLCGTKVLWKKDYERIARNRSFFGMHDPFGDFDLLFGAARLQLKIIDLPIRYKARTYGSSGINRLKDVWFLLWMSARAWWALKR